MASWALPFAIHKGDMVTDASASACEDQAARPKVIVICGATAVGKTAMGIALAAAVGGEIISADSMQVYRGMDIGTAKPTAEERAAVRHHLIDILDPDEAFDAAQFARLARQLVYELHRRQKVPVIVGGTGLYIKALLRGLFRSDPASPEVRQRLRAEAGAEGPAALHARLAGCDPDTARRIHPNDAVRILRALEVFEVAGRPLSQLQREHQFGDTPFTALKIGLSIEREELYQRIDRRAAAMVAVGLEAEVRSLLVKGYGPELKPMQSIGYSHMVAFIGGSLSREECLRTLKRDTRRFAKRQLTWFRADPQIVWCGPSQYAQVIELTKGFLNPG
jgi:tRNA dimethylallyltransferase